MAIPKFETLEVSVDGERGRLTLNRPERLNPLGSDALQEIAEAAHYLDTYANLKVVVVSGQGRAFSAGADVSRFGQPDAAGR